MVPQRLFFNYMSVSGNGLRQITGNSPIAAAQRRQRPKEYLVRRIDPSVLQFIVL
jgi:hypothetical protein